VTVDRRKFPRVKLHLPVRLYSSEDSLPTETETVDISRDGFYCVTDRPFEPGAACGAFWCCRMQDRAAPGTSGWKARLK